MIILFILILLFSLLSPIIYCVLSKKHEKNKNLLLFRANRDISIDTKKCNYCCNILKVLDIYTRSKWGIYGWLHFDYGTARSYALNNKKCINCNDKMTSKGSYKSYEIGICEIYKTHLQYIDGLYCKECYENNKMNFICKKCI